MRIDDKLKRIKNAGLCRRNGGYVAPTGYLILLMIAKDNESNDIQERIRQDSSSSHSTTASTGEDSEWEVRVL